MVIFCIHLLVYIIFLFLFLFLFLLISIIIIILIIFIIIIINLPYSDLLLPYSYLLFSHPPWAAGWTIIMCGRRRGCVRERAVLCGPRACGSLAIMMNERVSERAGE